MGRVGGKIDEQEIFPKNNHVSIFMNLKSLPYSVIISVTDQNISNLVAPLACLPVDKENPAIEISKHQVDYAELLPRRQFLNGNMYIPVITMTKKWQRTFWAFQHGSKVIRKNDKMICWVCAFCQVVDIVKIFLATSTLWIAEHLTKKHQQVNLSKTGDITLDGFRSEKTYFTLSRESAFLPVTPEQVGIFKLRLITWMVKKQSPTVKLKTKTSESLLTAVLWEPLARKHCYLVLAIPFEVGYLMSINGARYIYAKKY